MALYSRADRTSNVTSANACYEIIAGPAGAEILEIAIFLATAVTTVIGIGRPAAIGITPTTPLLVQANIVGDPAGVTSTAMAWGTGPTVPAHFLRRLSFPATIGAGYILLFTHLNSRQVVPAGNSRLIIPANSSIVLWNITGGATLDVHTVVSEGS